jgi:hypothetical protein
MFSILYVMVRATRGFCTISDTARPGSATRQSAKS